MTTTAYPPSIGGVQGYLADLCNNLHDFEADVATLWLDNRTDWLLGTTLRLSKSEVDVSLPVYRLGWSRAARARMAPWVFAYYALVTIAGPRIAAQMAPQVDRLVTPQHALIHSHRIGREFLAQASLAVARKRGLPFVLSPYHHPRWYGYRYAGWTKVYRAADAVLTLTEAEVKELERLGVTRDRIHVVGGAADDPKAGSADRFRASLMLSREPTVVFLGQLYAYKGVGQLLAAADALHASGVHLQLVFLGPETSFSRRLFAKQTRPWVRVLGRVDDQMKWDALEAASLVCVPSAQESFGRVYLEAWSKGKAVIGGRIPAVAEVVTEGVTGMLVDPSSISELEHALYRLITEPELANRLGAAGRHTLEARFSWQKVAARVEAVYDSLLTNSQPRLMPEPN
jgi:glycosyltransferase involved in cell wall biosynthesis